MTRAGVIGIAAFFVWVAPGQAQHRAPSPPATTPTAACDSCRALQQGLEALEKALQETEERLNRLKVEQAKALQDFQKVAEEYRQLRANVAEAGEFASAEVKSLLDQGLSRWNEAYSIYSLKSQQYAEEWKAADKLRAQIAALRGALAKCNPCKPKQTSQLFRGPVPYAAAGSLIALGAFIRGDSPTVIAATPVTPQQPVNVTPPSNPTTPSQPALDTIDVLMGLYLVQTCLCTFNPADQDAFIRLCQSVRQFRLTRTGTNTGRLDADAPLLRSDFVLDANSRTIDGAAIGLSLSYSGGFQGGEFQPNPLWTLHLSLDFGTGNTTTRYRMTAVKQ